MSKLRVILALAAAVVCSLAPLAEAEVLLKSSPIVSCTECWNRWGDFNGDGLDDLLVRNRLWLNLGGRLAEPVTLAAVSDRDAVTHIADLNGDKFADLILFQPAMQYPDDRPREEDGPTRMLFGDGQGGFTERAMPAGRGDIRQILDYTGDGVLDLLRWDFLGQDLSIMRGNGDGSFTLHQQLVWPHDQVISEFTPADVNGDGRLDIVAPHEGYLHIFFAQPDGKFGSVRTRFTRVELVAPRVADLNGDGKADLVFNGGLRESGVIALFGDGTGRFPVASHYTVPVPVEKIEYDRSGATDIQVGDFVAGGAAEVVYGKTGDGYVIVLGVANNQLVEIARLDLPTAYPLVRSVRFRSSKPELVVFGQVRIPRVSVDYYTWLIEPEGTVAAATAPARRRGRVIGRNSTFDGGRYHLGIDSKCPISNLRNLSLEREGMFVDVGISGPIEHAEAVYLEDGVFLRLQVRDGNTTRNLEGTLTPTPLGLSGKLFEWKDAPCGNGWEVHRVVATLSH